MRASLFWQLGVASLFLLSIASDPRARSAAPWSWAGPWLALVTLAAWVVWLGSTLLREARKDGG